MQEFLHRRLCTKKLLHTETSTRRNLQTEQFLSTETFTHRSLYAQKLVHPEAFTHRIFYTVRETFTQRTFQQSSSYTLSTRLFSRPISVRSLASTPGPSPRHPFPSVPLRDRARPRINARSWPPGLLPTHFQPVPFTRTVLTRFALAPTPSAAQL